MTDITCATAIQDMLTLYPDCEMRVPDVWRELDEKWSQALVLETLEALVQGRVVVRLNHEGTAWYSIAMDRVDASHWQDGPG